MARAATLGHRCQLAAGERGSFMSRAFRLLLQHSNLYLNADVEQSNFTLIVGFKADFIICL